MRGVAEQELIDVGRNRMKTSTSGRRRGVAAFATCVALVAGACGGKEQAATTSAPTSAAPAATAFTPTTAAPTTAAPTTAAPTTAGPTTTVRSQSNCNTWTIWQLLSDPEFKFTTFAKMVEAAGLVDLLEGPGPVAVFNVQDEYFTQWSAISGTPIEELFADKELLRKIISYHIVTEGITTETITPEYMSSAKFREYTTLEGSKLSLLTAQRVPRAYNINWGYPGGFTKMVASYCFANGYLVYSSSLLWPPDVDYAPFDRCPDVPDCGCRPKDDPGKVFYCRLVKQSEIGIIPPTWQRPIIGVTDLPPECSPVRILKHEAGTEECTFTELELEFAKDLPSVWSGEVTEDLMG